jgi:MraZ protein
LEDFGQVAAVEHPRGTYSARIDDKGRLKLPAAFHKFLTELGAANVFVTSFDRRIGKIYSIPVWKELEAKLDSGRSGKALLFVANDLGADAEVDSQGRLLLPAELRQAMNVENQQVKLVYHRGAIQFLNGAVYEEEKKKREVEAQEALAALEEEGIL